MADYHRNDTSGSQRLPTGANMTFASIQADLAALRAAAPAGVVDPAVLNIGKSEAGRDMHAIRIGKNPAMPVLIAGCHHAREWISVEMPIMFADFLVNNYSTDDRIKRIVDARDIWIVPLVNPDGHEHSVTVDRLWRKNFPGVAGRDSVDPNRNYDTTTWASPTGAFSDDPTNDSYRGPSGAFAKEVVNMQTLITSKRFKGSLDYHSFGRFVLFPFCGRTGPHPDPNQDTMADHVDHVVDSHGVPYLKLQASHLYRQPPWSRAPDDALVPGGLMDFVVENVPDSIAITVELEPEQSDPRGFVLPPSEIQPTFDRHLGSMLAFLNCVGTLATPATVRAMALAAGTSNNFSVFSSPCFSPFETF